MSIIEIKVAASGIEQSLLQRAGIPASIFNGKNQPCVLCGGRDRAHWSLKGKYRGHYYCRHCGNHDWLDLLNKYQQMPMNQTLSWLEDELGLKDMDSQKRKAIEIAAKRRQKIAEAKTRLQEENRNWDFNLQHELDELDWLIKHRQAKSRKSSEQMVRLEELAQLKRASVMIAKRGSNILSSSSFRKARKIYAELPKHKGDISDEIKNYANSLNESNIFDYGDAICDILMVREMLIDKKDKSFMSAALSHIHTLEKPPILPPAPVVEKAMREIFNGIVGELNKVAA